MNMTKVRGWQWLIALLALTILATLLFSPKTAAQENKGRLAEATSTVAVQVEKLKPPLSLPKILVDIGWCESKNDQSRTGYNYRLVTTTDANGATSTAKVLWSRDIGKYQINDYYHAKRAKALGYDIYTEEGNTGYALLLYNENGTRDWNPSKACWQDVDAWKARHQSYY